MKLINFLILFLLICLKSISSQNCKVLIVASAGDATWNTDVQNKLLSTGFFSVVDVININTNTPTLSQLFSYNTVLVYTNLEKIVIYRKDINKIINYSPISAL